MNLFKRLFSAGRKAPVPRFPKNEAEYESARRRYLNTYGKFASFAVVRTERGPLEVLVEKGTLLVMAVNGQPLKPEHIGLTVENDVRWSSPASSDGKDDALRAFPDQGPRS